MEPISSLLDYFERLLPLNETERELVRTSFHPRRFRKRQYALQEGDVSQYFYFVISGCLRMYKIDDNGAIHILQFAIENHWVTDLGSFHGEKPSELNIDALEDTQVLVINRVDLINLFLKADKFNRLFRVLIENSYVHLQKRLLQNISSTAEDRYRDFLLHHEDLSKRLPQVQIASWLGITPEFLSRLRARRKP